MMGTTSSPSESSPSVWATSSNVKALALIAKFSPAAWRHVHLNGHYTFRGGGQIIDLDAMLAGINLE